MSTPAPKTSWMRSPGFWNLPNSNTVARLFLVPVMVYLLWSPPTEMEWFAAFVIFIVAMITDIVDGVLARRWNLVSPAGAYLDPLADKLMVGTVLIMLIPLGKVSAWLVALLIARESAITGLRGIASQEGFVISASALGKIKTAFQGSALGFMLWPWPSFGLNPSAGGIVLAYIATFFALASAAEYLVQFFRLSAAKVSKA
jgi:CDP-diacylglycerol--glycerol-3-phosphate 3-phosphatidyltransferase